MPTADVFGRRAGGGAGLLSMKTRHLPNRAGTRDLAGYVYVSFTNAVAFSPTDVISLTRRVKMMMLAEAAVSATTSLWSLRGREHSPPTPMAARAAQPMR
jgi:hypothetical protein